MAMNIVGKWRIYEVLRFNESFEQEWVPVEKLLEDDELDSQDKRLYTATTEFLDDGRVLTLAEITDDIPKEDLDEAIKSGYISLYNGLMLVDEKHWKNEDGKYYYDTEIQGEVLGEEVSSWSEIKELDGNIEIPFLRMEKID